MPNPYQVVKDFEQALCDYTGAPFAVTTMSCTMALQLAVAWHLRTPPSGNRIIHFAHEKSMPEIDQMIAKAKARGEPVRSEIEIPKHTYVGVPMAIHHAGGKATFRDEQWVGVYQLKPLPVWDSARWFTSELFNTVQVMDATRNGKGPANGLRKQMICVSFHWSKTLGIQQGGAILLDDPEAAAWLRRARFDGRTEGVPVKDDNFDFMGWHCYLSPEIAAEGLQRIGLLPKHNNPLPWDDYPDLSKIELFQ